MATVSAATKSLRNETIALNQNCNEFRAIEVRCGGAVRHRGQADLVSHHV
jgi:hypothetical protein